MRRLRRFIAAVLIGLGGIAGAAWAAMPASGAGLPDPKRELHPDTVQARMAQAGQPGITSPAEGSSVSGSVPILGTAAGDPFARYELYHKREPSGDEAYSYFAGEPVQVQNGQLGVWHTDALPPGVYTLRMRVVRPDGNYREFFVRNINVNREVATPTPDAPTATPIPIDTPTPFPQPTVAPVKVDQPNIEEPTAELTAASSARHGGGANGGQPSSTDASTFEPSSEVLGDLGAALSLNHLRARFFTGVRWSAGLFLLLGAIFGAKRLLEWSFTKS